MKPPWLTFKIRPGRERLLVIEGEEAILHTPAEIEAFWYGTKSRHAAGHGEDEPMRTRTMVRSIRTQAKYGIPRVSNAFVKATLKEGREKKNAKRLEANERAAAAEAETREE